MTKTQKLKRSENWERLWFEELKKSKKIETRRNIEYKSKFSDLNLIDGKRDMGAISIYISPPTLTIDSWIPIFLTVVSLKYQQTNIFLLSLIEIM